MYIKNIEPGMMRPEYGVLVCRLLEYLPDGLAPPFGMSIVEVEPSGVVDLHSHHEHELWVLISGSGIFQEDTKELEVNGAMMFYMEPRIPHSIRNTQPEKSLTFLSVWWD